MLIWTGIALIAVTSVKADPLDYLNYMKGGFFDVNSADGLEGKSTQFNNSLYEGYVALAEESYDSLDLIDAEHFNHKARSAARHLSVLPDTPDDRNLGDAQKAEFALALTRLRRVFNQGGKVIAPNLTAKAQINYECWIEETEADNSILLRKSNRGNECKKAFDEAMNVLDATATFKLTDFDPDSYSGPFKIKPTLANCSTSSFLCYTPPDIAQNTVIINGSGNSNGYANTPRNGSVLTYLNAYGFQITPRYSGYGNVQSSGQNLKKPGNLLFPPANFPYSHVVNNNFYHPSPSDNQSFYAIQAYPQAYNPRAQKYGEKAYIQNNGQTTVSNFYTPY